MAKGDYMSSGAPTTANTGTKQSWWGWMTGKPTETGVAAKVKNIDGKLFKGDGDKIHGFGDTMGTGMGMTFDGLRNKWMSKHGGKTADTTANTLIPGTWEHTLFSKANDTAATANDASQGNTETKTKTNQSWINPRSYLPEMLGGHKKVHPGVLGWRNWSVVPTFAGGITKTDETQAVNDEVRMWKGVVADRTRESFLMGRKKDAEIAALKRQLTYTLTRFQPKNYSNWSEQERAQHFAALNQGPPHTFMTGTTDPRDDTIRTLTDKVDALTSMVESALTEFRGNQESTTGDQATDFSTYATTASRPDINFTGLTSGTNAPRLGVTDPSVIAKSLEHKYPSTAALKSRFESSPLTQSSFATLPNPTTQLDNESSNRRGVSFA